jgi:hypothetical protein
VTALLDRIRIARVPLGYALLVAFGAALFADAAGRIPLALLLRLFGAGTGGPAPFLFELVTAAVIAVAVSVAWLAGGRVAAGAYLAFIALERIVALYGSARFCERIRPEPFECSLVGQLVGLWPYLLGVAAAVALVRRLRPSAGGRNPTLEAAGAFALAQVAILLAYALLSSGGSGTEGGIISLLAAVAGGVACGVVLDRRATRPWRSLGVVALAVLATWALLDLSSLMEQIGAARSLTFRDPQIVFAQAGPPLAMAVAAFVLYISATRKVPRE